MNRRCAWVLCWVVISLINRSRETTKTQRRDTTKRHNEAVSWLRKIIEVRAVFEKVYFICW